MYVRVRGVSLAAVWSGTLRELAKSANSLPVASASFLTAWAAGLCHLQYYVGFFRSFLCLPVSQVLCELRVRDRVVGRGCIYRWSIMVVRLVIDQNFLRIGQYEISFGVSQLTRTLLALTAPARLAAFSWATAVFDLGLWLAPGSTLGSMSESDAIADDKVEGRV